VSKNPEQKEAARLAKLRRRWEKENGRGSKKMRTMYKHASGHNDGLPRTPTS